MAQMTPLDTVNSIWLTWINSPVITHDGTIIRVANLIGAAYGANLLDNYLSEKLKTLISHQLRLT